MEMLQTNIKFF